MILEEGVGFEGNKTAFLGTLKHEGREKFLREISRKIEGKIDVEEFKENFLGIVVEFGVTILM